MRVRTRVMIAAVAVLTLIGEILAVDETPSQKPATTQPSPSIPAPAGWKLVWNDEFDGSVLDRAKWDFDIGNDLPAGNRRVPGWGNNELEFYTSRPENVFISDGMLHLRAQKESYEGCKYTSGRIKTKDRFSKTYGRFEFRAKLPTGKGIWPAIWLLPEKNEYGGWPASGEIDLMEARGQQPEKVLGTLHYGSRGPGHPHAGKDFLFPDRGTIADFHVYALEWDPVKSAGMSMSISMRPRISGGALRRPAAVAPNQQAKPP